MGMTNEELLQAIQAMMAAERKASDAKFEQMQKDSNERFGKIDERFEKIDERFGKIDERFEKMEAKIEASKSETLVAVKAMLENGVEKQIKLLAEGHELILEKLQKSMELQEEIKGLKGRVSTLEHVTAQHSEDIRELKRA